MKTRPKIFNRVISFLYLGLFLVGIACVGIATYFIVVLYNENQYLSEIKNNLLTQTEKYETFEELHYDDYYSVYVEDGYALYDDTENDPLIYFTK